MPAFGKKKNEKPTQFLAESPEDIRRRRQAISAMAESRVGEMPGDEQPTGIAAEKPMGTLCHLPKSVYRLATRYAEDHDLTAKRFFFETMLLGLEQQGVITTAQRTDALTLPNDYGWKSRKR